MNSLPYHKRYHRDFLEGTAGMPFELKGAYSVLLDVIYLHEGAPDDTTYIAGQLGCSVRKWNSIREQLIERGKIRCKNGIISTSRADKEILIQRSYRDQKAENRRGSSKNNDMPQTPVDTEVNTKPEPVEVVGVGREGERGVFNRVLAALKLNSADRLPTRWMPPAAEIHVHRWTADLGLSEDEVVAVCAASRERHPTPPDGPKALDRAMASLAAEKSAPTMRAHVTPFPSNRRQTDGERTDELFRDLSETLRRQQYGD